MNVKEYREKLIELTQEFERSQGAEIDNVCIYTDETFICNVRTVDYKFEMKVR